MEKNVQYNIYYYEEYSVLSNHFCTLFFNHSVPLSIGCFESWDAILFLPPSDVNCLEIPTIKILHVNVCRAKIKHIDYKAKAQITYNCQPLQKRTELHKGQGRGVGSPRSNGPRRSDATIRRSPSRGLEVALNGVGKILPRGVILFLYARIHEPSAHSRPSSSAHSPSTCSRFVVSCS